MPSDERRTVSQSLRGVSAERRASPGGEMTGAVLPSKGQRRRVDRCENDVRLEREPELALTPARTTAAPWSGAQFHLTNSQFRTERREVPCRQRAGAVRGARAWHQARQPLPMRERGELRDRTTSAALHRRGASRSGTEWRPAKLRVPCAEAAGLSGRTTAPLEQSSGADEASRWCHSDG